MKIDNQDILTDSFLQNLLIKRHSSVATRDVYKRELGFFLLYLKEKKLNIETVKISDIREYLIVNSKKRNLSSSTNSRIITVLRLFFVFAEEEGIISVNPTELLENVKHKKIFPETINENQVDYFLSVINTSTDLGLRDKAIFELIYSCGLRVSECCSLKIQNYYKDEKKIVVTGKGNKQRIIPVGDYAINSIDEYLEKSREKLLKKKSDYVFVSLKGDKLSRQEIWVRLKIYAEKAGLRLKVHTLRHSFASSLLKNGADLRSVQEFLGHSDIRTTEIYTHINTEDLYSAFKTHHPQQKQQV